MTNEIRVLLIEDDPMVQEVNKQFIERLSAFKVVDTSTNGLDGLKKSGSLNPTL